MRQPRSVTMDNGAQRWHVAPHRQAIVKIFHHMPLPHIVIWPTAIKTTRDRPSYPLWKQCIQFKQTNISLNPQVENIPSRSTKAAWSSLLMLLNANPPCLLRGQSKYFGKCQDARGVPCLYAYGAPFRHLLYPAYQCIPMYTLLYLAYLTIIDLNASKDIACTHCLCGSGFMQMCIEHMHIYDRSKKFDLQIFERRSQPFWSWYG